MLEIATMTPADIVDAIELWRDCEGVSLRGADSPEGITRYLERNPGCSFVARDQGKLVGAALAGHDGRRGYLNHVAMARTHRSQGIGRTLVERCLAALREHGIHKCHLFVFETNAEGRKFWGHLGWHERGNLLLMSFTEPGSENA